MNRSKRVGLRAARSGCRLRQPKLIEALILLFLLRDIRPHRGLVSPHRRNPVAACPKVLPHMVVFTPTPKSR